MHQVVERKHKARRDKDGSNTATNLRNQTLAQVDISRENLLWLGNWYVSLDVDRAIAIFSHFLQSDFDETACYQLGKLYASTGQTENQIAQLETLMKLYNDFPESKWRFENESRLLLAKAYQSTGCEKKALSLLEEVAIGPILDITIAEAYLEKALAYISQQYPEDKTAPQLKNLILQKRLEFEPIHLEAALKYVELLEKTAPNPLEKRLFLLEKVKSDFEKTDDVLSKDYHYARLHNVEKNQIYEDYMNYIDHEIFLAKSTLINDVSIQKELQAKAKDFLLQIKCESSHPWLIPRVIQKLALGWD
ncbi:MAG TPA: hypothetical protein VLE95_04945 [Chlamydiales bacterium]|nr:hypothetical protein [Chlamydiales bacterium]